MLFQTCASIFAVCSSGCPGTGWCRSWSWPTWGPQLQMRWDQTLFANYVSAYCKVPNRIYRIFWGVFWHFLARQITYSVQNLWGQFWPWPIWGPLFATYFSYYVLLKKLHWNRIDLVYFWRFLTFFGQTNHLPCAESLRPILALTNLRTSSAVALGSNSMAWNWPSMKWNRA